MARPRRLGTVARGFSGQTAFGEKLQGMAGGEFAGAIGRSRCHRHSHRGAPCSLSASRGLPSSRPWGGSTIQLGQKTNPAGVLFPATAAGAGLSQWARGDGRNAA